MSADACDTDDDLEAEFQAELAKLALEPHAVPNHDLQSSPRSPRDTFLTALGHGAEPIAETDEEDDAEDDELESFRLLRAAVARREHALEEFGRDLVQAHQEITAAALPPGPCAPAAASKATTDEPAADVNTAASIGNPDIRSVVAELTAASQASSAGSSSTKGPGLDTDPGSGLAGVAVSGRPPADAGGDDAGEAAATRKRLQDEYRAQEAARQAERERQRQAAEAAAAAEAAEAEARLRRLQKELEQQEIEALAALEAERAAAAAEREAQLAAAAAERERLAAEQAATAARLAAAAREAAAREAERRAAAEALEREALAMARRHLAARRIQRAWRRYAAGPQRAARLAGVVRIQAAWRGFRDRRRVAVRRQQRDVLRNLEDAAVKGRLEELRLAVERAKELGLGDAAQQRVAAVESASADAAAKLRTAAEGGSVMAFRAALGAARRFPHLAEVAAQSSAVFEGRRAAALAAVQAAVADAPMSSFLQLLDAAGSLGVDSAQLAGCLEAVRRRDAQLAAQLAAAAAAGGAAFDPAGFAALAERGLRLGLQGDVAAARRAVERRARSLAAELRQAAAGASGREVAALAAEARRLGMAGEAAALEAQLQQRQRALQSTLEAAASRGSATHFAALLRRADWLGLSPSMTQPAHTLFSERQARCSAALAAAAGSDTLHAFLAARGAAVRAGVGLEELLAADRALAARRRQAAAALLAACAQLCGVGGGDLSGAGAAVAVMGGAVGAASARALAGVAEALASAMGLGDPRVILARAVDRLAGAAAAGTAAEPRALGAQPERVQPLPPPPQPQPQRPERQHKAAAQAGPAGDGSGPGRPPPYADTLPPAPLPQMLSAVEAALQRGLVLPLPLAEGGGPTGPGPGPGLSRSGGTSGAAAASAHRVLGSVWSAGVACMQLGLPDAACVALCALGLHCTVQMAEGSYVLRRMDVPRDYWGVPQLPPWQRGTEQGEENQGDAGGRAIAARPVRGDGSSNLQGGGGEGGAARDGDRVAAHVWERLRRSGLLAAVRFWPPCGDIAVYHGVSVPQAQLHFWRAFLGGVHASGPGRGSNAQPTAPTPSAPATPGTPDNRRPNAAPHRAAPGNPPRPQPSPSRRGPAAVPLTRAVILRNSATTTTTTSSAATTTAGSSAAPPRLDRLTRLDLGLEGLSSLAGLDVSCPALRSLSADANQLSSLEGLAGLSRLTSLSLKHNQLTSLVTTAMAAADAGKGAAARAGGSGGVLPGGGCLRRLALDSNQLAGRLEGLHGCSGLRVLSLSSNALSELGPGLQPCAASLAVLCLRGNCLTGLAGALSACTGLRSLDVSANRLTSLDGIQGLALLQSLDAHANALTCLPQPLSLPQLTSLDLSQNALTAFFGAFAEPAAGAAAAAAGAVSTANTGTIGPWTPPVLLPSLQRLNLSENRIASIDPLGPMRNLTSLDLSFNALTSLKSLHALVGLTSLLTLNVGDNPATTVAAAGAAGPAALPGRAAAPPPHRPVVLSILPSLRELDHEGISEAERAGNAVRAAATCPVAAAALTAAVRMGAFAGGACLPMQRRSTALAAANAGDHSALSSSSAGMSTSSSRRSRAPPGGRRRGNSCGVAPTPPLCRTVGVSLGSVGAADATALRSLLSAAAAPSPLGGGSAIGAAAGLGNVQPVVPGYAAVYSPSQPSAQPQLAAAPRPPAVAGARTLRSPSAPAEGWLTRTEQLWAATLPYNVTAAHRRHLAVAQRLLPPGAAATTGGTGTALAPPEALATSIAAATGGRASPAEALLQSGELLDEPLLRVFQPVAGARSWLEGRGGHGGGAGAGVTPAALADAAEARYEAAEAELRRALAREVQRLAQPLQDIASGAAAAAGSSGAAAAAALPEAVLLTKASYYHACVASANAVVRRAATTIQAAWRGYVARRLASELRSELYQERCAAAATRIQAAWRGHRVRCGRELTDLRAAATAERREREREERRRREAAAVVIQAHVRGHLVRRRLRAALAASRLPWGDDSGGDSDMEGLGGEGEDLLAFLAPLEKLFRDETPAAPTTAVAAAAAVASRAPPLLPAQATPPALNAQPQLAQQPQQQQQVLASVRAPAFSGSVVASNASPFGVGSVPQPAPGLPQAWAGPPVLPHVAAAGALAPGYQQTAASAALAAVALAHPSPSHHAGLLPPLPHSPAAPAGRMPIGGGGSNGMGGGGGRPSPLLISENGSGELSDVYGNGRASEYGGSVGGTSPGEDLGGGGGGAAGTPSTRQARHLARLQALMAEWGFKDLATAEAYYRRTLRQKQGQTRKKLEDKYHDPAQRLRKLQQAVSANANGPAGRSPDGQPPRAPPHGRPLPLAHGSLRGPPSRQSVPGNQGSPVAAGSGGGGGAGAAGAAVARPQRNLSSADDALKAAGGGRSVPAGGLPALRPRSASQGASTFSPLLAGAGGPNGGASPAAAAAGRVLRTGGSEEVDEDHLSVRSFTSAGGSSAAGGAWEGRPAPLPLPPAGAAAAARLSQGMARAAAAPPPLPHPRPNGRALLPALANNWIASPSHTPPGHNGGVGSGGGGSPQLVLAPAPAAGAAAVGLAVSGSNVSGGGAIGAGGGAWAVGRGMGRGVGGNGPRRQGR